MTERERALVDAAKSKMIDLSSSDTATIREISACLVAYRYYPEEVDDIRERLAQKHERMIAVAQAELTQLLHSSDIVHIDNSLRGIHDADESLKSSVELLERHRTELVRSVSVKLQAALG